VAAQRAVARHGRGGGSSELGVARATRHHFRRGLALRVWRDTTNSHRVVLDDGGDQKRVRADGRDGSNLGAGKRELQGMKPVGKRPNDCDTMSRNMKCGRFGEGRANAVLGFGSLGEQNSSLWWLLL
jgi:hypothetical protein